MSISAIILAKNEEKNLPRLLSSLGWVDEVIVVDDASTDRTAEIANNFRARVISNRLQDFSSQFNLGLRQAAGDWILRLDADEEVPLETVQQLQAAVMNAAPEVGGFRILRRNFVLGRWLQHGQEYGKRVAWYDFVRRRRGYRVGDYLGGAVKLFRRRGSAFVNLVHEEVELAGRVVQLQAYVNHYTGETIEDIFNKVNFYTTLHARQLYRQSPQKPPRHFYRLILGVPFMTFLSLYIRKQGFRDGFPGLVRCLSSSSYEFLKYLKLRDYYQQAGGHKTPV